MLSSRSSPFHSPVERRRWIILPESMSAWGPMNECIRLSKVLIVRGEESAEHLALFALINLGLIESLANGILTATEAVRLFYRAEHCMFVRKHVANKTADQIMSHGVQLSDLFEALPTEEAFREFQHELSAMRSLCLKILDTEKQVA